MSLAAKQVCLGPVKRATCTDFVGKSRAFPQQPDFYKRGLFRGSKIRNNAIQFVWQLGLQNKLRVFCCLFYHERLLFNTCTDFSFFLPLNFHRCTKR